MIRAIVAVDKKWGIGKNNDLLFHLSKDMKFFRSFYYTAISEKEQQKARLSTGLLKGKS